MRGTVGDLHPDRKTGLAISKTKASFLSFLAQPENEAAVFALLERSKSPSRAFAATEAMGDVMRSSLFAPIKPNLPPQKQRFSISKTVVESRTVGFAKTGLVPIDSRPLDVAARRRPAALAALADSAMAETQGPAMEKTLLERLASGSHTDEEFVACFTEGVYGLPAPFRSFVGSTVAGLDKEGLLKLVRTELAVTTRERRAFDLLRGNSGKDFLTRAELRPFVENVVESYNECFHLRDPGTSAFRERYVLTVLESIFFVFDLNDDGRLEFEEFARLSFLSHVDAVFDKISEFNVFNYDGFYAVCCLFNDLTSENEDFLLRGDFEQFNNHALNPIVIDRIFSEAPRRFKSKGKMHFEDFVWFLLSEEEKSAPQALRYWFRLLDENCDQIISLDEIKRYYEVTKNRMECLDNDSYDLRDILSLLLDMFGQETPEFRLRDFQKRTEPAVNLINTLTNVSKFRELVKRDPYLRPTMKPFSDLHAFVVQKYASMTDSPDAEDPEEEIDVALDDKLLE